LHKVALGLIIAARNNPIGKRRPIMNIQRTILIVEEDTGECLRIKHAVHKSGIQVTAQCVKNCADLLDYLQHKGQFADTKNFPPPSLVLLDLDLQAKNSIDGLRQIKAHPEMRRIPVLILTNSKSSKDMDDSYEMGANSFIMKPSSIDEYSDAMKVIYQYWFENVELPTSR
jgi:DNA-binding response OmpR family regulator